MQKADAWGARFAGILGDDELARGEAAVKELVTGTQNAVALDRQMSLEHVEISVRREHFEAVSIFIYVGPACACSPTSDRS